MRKMLHLGMGVFALSFPWLFTTVGPAVVLCAASVGLLWSIRRVAWLQQRFGSVLGNVQRCSHGEMYFALGVTALFCLARHSLLLYALPLLILTFADAAAALIGGRFGAHPFRVMGGPKSLEGSLAFFTVAGVTTFVGLAWIAALTIWHALLLAGLLALWLTFIEAGAGRGLDNLFLPLGAFWLLDFLLYRTAEEVTGLLLLTLWAVVSLFIIGRELFYDSTARPTAQYGER